jgi:hypothetical protein
MSLVLGELFSVLALTKSWSTARPVNVLVKCWPNPAKRCSNTGQTLALAEP